MLVLSGESIAMEGEAVSFYQQFGKKLRQVRREAGLSQVDLAIAIGLTRTSISNIENGRQGVPLCTFGKMVQVLKVQSGTLLPAADVPSASPSPELLRLPKKEREFIERGIPRLGKEKS